MTATGPTTHPTFEMTASRSKLALNELFIVAVFGIYLALLIVGPNPLLRVLGGFGVIVFGTVALIGIPSLVRSRTVLVTFTVDGIHATKGATIAWPNLESVRREGVRPRPAWPLRRFAAKSLVFVPGDIDRSLEGIVGLRRWRLRNAARVYGGPVVVARMTIAETFDEVLAAVGRHAGAAVLDGAP